MPFISQALWRDTLRHLTIESPLSPFGANVQIDLRRIEARLDDWFLQSRAQSGPASDGSGSNVLLDLFKKVAEASILLAALLYAMGWTYLYSYYKTFGLSLRELDLPLQDSLVFSFRVVSDSWLIATGFVLILAILASIASLERIQRALQTPWGVSAVFVLLLVAGSGLSVLGASVGTKHARSDVLETTSSLPSVSVAVDPAQFQPYPEEYLAFNTLDYKLLLRTKENVFFFAPVKTTRSTAVTRSRNFDVYVLPMSKIRSIRIQRGM